MSYNQYVSYLQKTDNAVVVLTIAVLLVLAVTYLTYRLKPAWLKPRLWHVLALAFVLRLPLMVEPFWYDETFTGVVASLPDGLRDVVVRSDVHPMGAYELFSGGVLDANEYDINNPNDLIARDAIMRSIPFLTGLLVVYLTYKIAFILYPQSALLSALIVALMPAQILYSAEARIYMVMVAFVLLGFWGIWRVHRPNDWWINCIAILVSLTMLTAIHAHGFLWFGVLVAMALWRWLFMATRWKMQPHRAEIISNILVMVIIAYATTGAGMRAGDMLAKAGDVADGFWLRDVTLGSFISSLHDVTIGGRFPSGIAFVAIIAVLMVTFWAVRYTKTPHLWGMILIVPLITAGISVFWHSIYLSRALLPAGVFIAIAWAKLATESPHGRALVGITIMIPLVMMYHPEYQKTDNRALIAQCADSDVIYAPATNMAIIARWYSDKPIFISESPNDLNQWLSDDALDALGFIRADLSQMYGMKICVPFIANPALGISQRFLLTDLNWRVASGNAKKTVLKTTPIMQFMVYEVMNNAR